MDHLMERCEVQGLVPPSDMPHDPAADIDYSGKMDVWLLDNSRELSRYVLWERTPKRVKKLTTFQFLQNSEQSTIVESFHCRSQGFSTFEFVCSDETPNCKVDFWWVKKTPLNGKHTPARNQFDDVNCCVDRGLDETVRFIWRKPLTPCMVWEGIYFISVLLFLITPPSVLYTSQAAMNTYSSEKQSKVGC